MSSVQMEVDQNYWKSVAIHQMQRQREEEMAPLNLTTPRNNFQLSAATTYLSYCTSGCSTNYKLYDTLQTARNVCMSEQAANLCRSSHMYQQSEEMNMHNQYILPSSTNTSTLPPAGSLNFVLPHTTNFSMSSAGFLHTMKSVDMLSSEPMDDTPKQELISFKYPVKYASYVINSYMEILSYDSGFSMLLRSHVLKHIFPYDVLKCILEAMKKLYGQHDDVDNDAPKETSSDGNVTSTGQQNTVGSGKEVPADAEMEDENSREYKIKQMAMRNFHSALQCVLNADESLKETEESRSSSDTIRQLIFCLKMLCQKCVTETGAKECADYEDLRAKTNTKHKHSMENSYGEEPSESKTYGSNLKIQVPITLANGSAGRLQIFGPVYVMTEERHTQTLRFFIEDIVKNTGMKSKDYEITPREYSPVLKSHSAAEEIILEDDYDSDADNDAEADDSNDDAGSDPGSDSGSDEDGDCDVEVPVADDNDEGYLMRHKHIEALFDEQRNLHNKLVWSQGITCDLKRYQHTQQIALQNIYLSKRQLKNQPPHVQQQIPQQYSQHEVPQEQHPHYAQQHVEYDEDVDMEEPMHEDENSRDYEYQAPYSPLPVPPPIPEGILNMCQDEAAAEYQNAYPVMNDQFYPENNQAIDLTARTLQMQQRASQKPRVSRSRPGEKLEFIANRLMQLGQFGTENKIST